MCFLEELWILSSKYVTGVLQGSMTYILTNQLGDFVKATDTLIKFTGYILS